ncbi:MAG: nitrophenyl compound nitroreductase subunit ArsF family protein [Phycisphaerales bacterium]
MSADDPQAARVGTDPAAQDGVVFAYYFHRTFRCYSCSAMEVAAVDVMEEHFARQMEDGQVVWTLVNIEDPTTTALQQQLEVRGNGLVLARMENGVYKDSKRLDELWGLMDRPDAFSKYLVDEVNARLSPVPDR